MRARLFSFVMVLIASVAQAFTDIPITAVELLPGGVSGLTRTNEVATGGIPLPADSGITSASQLGLTGASAAQFRILGHWPSGAAKWVLVDAMATVPAGGSGAFTLTTGSGAFGGSYLATDNGSTITVSTGAATFTIKKANFNVFDAVSVGATTLVTSGNVGCLSMVLKDGTTVTSANDASSTASVEENGPVRAVIKATGAFKSAGGTRHMDYTLRLYFYKNSASVKGNVELRNASQTNAYLTRDFRSVEIIVPLTLAGAKTVSFGKNDNGAISAVTYSLGGSETSYLFQGFFQGNQVSPAYNFVTQGYYWQPPLPGSGSDTYTYDPSYVGLKIQGGGSVLNAFGTRGQRATGVASMNLGSGAGVTLAYRSLFDYWPGGFEFKDDGTASIELYSKQNPYNSTNPIKLGFGQHDSREVMWDFHTSATSDDSVLWRLSYPLAVRASLTHYASTKAVYGQEAFVTPAEQSSVYSTLATSVNPVNVGSPSLSNPTGTWVFRGWPWDQGGGWNQNNHAGDDLVDWLRTESAGWYLRAESRARFIGDTALGRSDDFTTEIVSTNDEGQMWPKLLSSGGADGEHTYVYGLPLYYYLSGNEQAKEAWLDYGDRLLRNNITGYYALPYNQWLRGYANTLRNTALVYEFGCETDGCSSALKSAVEGAIAYQLDSRESGSYGPGGQGRNMARGYLYWDVDVQWNGQNKRLVHSIYHNQVHFESLYQTWRVMSSTGWNYNRINELEDFMTGLSRFYLDDWYDYPASSSDTLGVSPFFFPVAEHYDYLLDEITPYSGQGASVPMSTGRAAIWAYQQTGDASYLSKGANMVWEQTAYSGDSVRVPSELQEQAVMYYYLHPDELTYWSHLPVSTVNNGGGSYTLTWTNPVGAKQIRLKHGSGTVVDWLGFNKTTRTYTYNPASYTPYFAATNDAQPSPAGDGVIQSASLTGLPVSGISFAALYTTFGVSSSAHTITASASSGGSISPSGAVSVSDGGTQAFTITPSGGYTVSSVTVDGSSVGAVTSYTFSGVTGDHTIGAVFALPIGAGAMRGAWR